MKRVVKIEAQPSYFNQLQGVLKSHETLFSLFDLTSQTINDSWGNSKQKFTKFTVVFSFIFSSLMSLRLLHSRGRTSLGFVFTNLRPFKHIRHTFGAA